MKRVLIFMLLYGHLYALDTQSTLNVYRDLLSSLVPKQVIRVYVPDQELHEVFAHSKKMIPVPEPTEADIVIVPNQSVYRFIRAKLTSMKEKKMPLFFATDYRVLRDSDEVVGALYWRKGRSQLLFVDERLQKHGIKLPVRYQRYSVDAL
jgi:hypothetical protein